MGLEISGEDTWFFVLLCFHAGTFTPSVSFLLFFLSLSRLSSFHVQKKTKSQEDLVLLHSCPPKNQPLSVTSHTRGSAHPCPTHFRLCHQVLCVLLHWEPWFKSASECCQLPQLCHMLWLSVHPGVLPWVNSGLVSTYAISMVCCLKIDCISSHQETCMWNNGYIILIRLFIIYIGTWFYIL